MGVSIRFEQVQRPLPARCATFAAGFLAMPLAMALFAQTVAWWFGANQVSSAHAAALRATQDLTEALDRYSSQFLRIPDEREGLGALAPRYVSILPLDPWGNPFVYAPSTGTLWADVLSYGADGQPGGEGSAADVSGRFGRLDESPPRFLSAVGRIALCTIPLLALLAAQRRDWPADVLAGMASFWAGLLFATLDLSSNASSGAFASFVVGLVCMAASIATLRNLRGGREITCLAVVATSLLLEHLITLP
jgi:general secretion pathway protein G